MSRKYAPSSAPLVVLFAILGSGVILLVLLSITGKSLGSPTSPSAQSVLPPDPGEAGKTTLAGIDSDGDGVRDDIQRYIVLTYSDSEKTRAALMQQARAWQAYLLNASDEEKAIRYEKEQRYAADCLSYILNDNTQILVHIRESFRPLMLNTLQRQEAATRARQHLTKYTFDVAILPAERKSHCNFDPDTMKN